MDDIKRRSPNSQSKRVHQAPLLRAHQRDLYRKVEEFESDVYEDENDENAESNDIRSFYNSRREEERKPFRISKFSLIGSFLFVLFVTSVLLFTFVFNGATITVTPRTYSFAVDTEINMASSSDVGYVASSTETIKKTLDRSEKKKVQSKAAGQITIYNNYTEDTQKLVKNTRFEAPNGIIFRITDSVVVPGKKNGIPGSVVAKVTADSFGENYNIKPSKFTIPGFKNSPRFDGFYAESKVAMTGGADGDRYVVSSDAIALADTGMQNTLKTNLTKIILEKDVPSDYILATSSIYIEYSNNLEAYESGKADSYEVTGIAYVYLLAKESLAEKIAKTSMPNSVYGQTYRVLDYSTLTINPKSTMQKEDVLTLKGEGVLIYDTDYEKIKSELAGKDENEYSQVFSDFPSVEKADIDISPFWVHSFPKNINKLKIEEVLPSSAY